jgi:hypothetical protein
MDWFKRSGKKKAEQSEAQPELGLSRPLPRSDLEETQPEIKEFIEIGGSPVPGLTLRTVLRGHTSAARCVSFSADIRLLSSYEESKEPF